MWKFADGKLTAPNGQSWRARSGPYGTVPGTQGCIGLIEMDTSDAYSLLKKSRGELVEVS